MVKNLNGFVQMYTCSKDSELKNLKRALVRVPVSFSPLEGMAEDNPFGEFMTVAELGKKSDDSVLSRCNHERYGMTEGEMEELNDSLPEVYPRIRINGESFHLGFSRAHRRHSLDKMFLPTGNTKVLRASGSDNAICIVWEVGGKTQYVEIGVTKNPLYGYPV